MTPSPIRAGMSGAPQGVAAVVDGLGVLLRDGGQRQRAVVPVLLTVVLYVSALLGVAWGSEPLLEVVWSEPDLGWSWARVAWVLVRWLLAAVLFVGLCFLFAAVLEIVAGPFFDAMARAELVRRGWTPVDTGFWDGTVLEAARALLMALPLLVLGILTLIPAWTPVAGPLATAWAWFGLGAGAVNPALVATGHRLPARLGHLVRHLGFTLGQGAAVGAFLLVPVVGWAALPAAVIGASRRVDLPAGEPGAASS